MKYFFSDFDGTLTHHGLISEDFLTFLNLIKKKKLELIIVSGRSASWGHFFVTHFPVQYAVMESGGVIILKNSKQEINTLTLANNKELDHLKKVEKSLRDQFPKLEFAADNMGRLSDRAIELKSLKELKLLNKVESFLKKNKCFYSVSNIHLNYSASKIDKWVGVKFFIKNILKKKLSDVLAQSVFAGDSLNDEIMFEHMPLSLGVKNIKPYLAKMNYHPKKISSKAEIKGVLHFLQQLNNH